MGDLDVEHGSQMEIIRKTKDEEGVPSPGSFLGSDSRDDDGRIRRTGTVWTATAHIITAVIGSGVLSLAWSIAQLGWIVGPVILISFSFVTYYTSWLLSDCYRSPNPVTGKRNYTYMDAVKANLGGMKIFFCGLTQYMNLLGATIGYTITSSISMVAIRRSNCFHQKGHNVPCHISNNPYMISFGVIQIFLSQIPNFDRLWWLSIVAAIMSFSYSTIGIGLGIGKIFGGNLHGMVEGVNNITQAKKVWQAFQALGNIAFAYSYSMILIEIQDTIRSPPPENKTMKKSTLIGIFTTTMFYMASGCIGYAAFGNNAPGNLLTGFGYYNPYWLIDFANLCIVIHLIGAYQVYAQPLFAFIEDRISSLFPKSKFINEDHKLHVPLYGIFPLNIFRLIWRTLFVIITTVVSMLLPFFNDILGILGALGFWPLTIYFPIEMHISKLSIKRWSLKWNALQFLSMVCLFVTMAALLGSIEGVLQQLRHYKPFHTKY